MPDGTVLVSGGIYSGVGDASAKIYDPVAGKWAPTGNLGTARYSHTATLLPNGKVLVAGGSVTSMSSLASAEIY
jgi:hypothetical protein